MSEPVEPVCEGCGIPLSEDECYACADCCDLWELLDPNGYMAGDDDE